MTSPNVVLLCRWEGEIVYDGPNVMYRGGRMEPLILKPHMTFNDLVNKIHTTVGSNPMNVQLNINMRFESVSGVQVISVERDEHLDVLRTIVAMRSLPTDIYVELNPICNQQDITSQSFPNLHQQPTYFASQQIDSLQISPSNIPPSQYGMGYFTSMLNSENLAFQSTSHIASPIHDSATVPTFHQSHPSSSNTALSSPLHSYSPMQEDPQQTPFQNLVDADNIVDRAIPVEEMYDDTNDEVELDEEVDDDAIVGGVRSPIPWFTQINENYEVDMQCSGSGNRTSFAIGGI